jgi:putative membrane protein
MARIEMGLMGVMAGSLVPGIVAAQDRPYEWGWGMHPMGWMWGAWGIGMMLLMLAFWGLVIVGLVLGIRWLVSQGKESRSDSALEILRQRYARGEINKDEFEAKKRDLS